jgi:cytochrome c-type biogenesis protein CcmH
MWVLFAILTAAAMFAVLWPLSRPARIVADTAHDAEVYRDQLAEIERDLARGLIGQAEADAARVEVSRRLLAAAAAPAAPVAGGATGRRRIAALTALLVVPGIAFGLYSRLGSPALPDMPLAERLDSRQTAPPIDAMVAQVERHLAQNPQDGRGWEVLAPIYLQSGRVADAVKARTSALRLLGETADRQADLGEALVANAQGVVTAEAKAAFNRAATLEADHPKARFFIGLAAEQDGDKARAIAIWNDMIAKAQPGASYVEFLRAAVTRLEGTPASPAAALPPGPTGQDMAAAAEMKPQERDAMVRGMVDRLAARLAADGSDADGWVRLVRAYLVLGEVDKARAALADARKALAANPEKLNMLETQVRSLGLQG